MPKRISKYHVLATWIVMCGVTRVEARGLKDRNPFTQWLVQQATYVELHVAMWFSKYLHSYEFKLMWQGKKHWQIILAVKFGNRVRWLFRLCTFDSRGILGYSWGCGRTQEAGSWTAESAGQGHVPKVTSGRIGDNDECLYGVAELIYRFSDVAKPPICEWNNLYCSVDFLGK